MVCNAKGINANAVAEHTMALILAWYKNIVTLDTFMKAHRAEDELNYSGAELEGKTILKEIVVPGKLVNFVVK